MAGVPLSTYDFQRLSLLVRKYRASPFSDRMALNSLESKLERATLLPPQQMPSNVVTMYSTVKVTDLVTRKRHQFTLVFPKQTSQGRQRISILAPVGIALLGERVGAAIECWAPKKTLRLRIDELIYQPEAVGELYA